MSEQQNSETFEIVVKLAFNNSVIGTEHYSSNIQIVLIRKPKRMRNFLTLNDSNDKLQLYNQFVKWNSWNYVRFIVIFVLH